VMKHLDDVVRATPGVQHTLNIPGYSILTSNNISNAGGMFVILAPFEERRAKLEKLRGIEVTPAERTAAGAEKWLHTEKRKEVCGD